MQKKLVILSFILLSGILQAAVLISQGDSVQLIRNQEDVTFQSKIELLENDRIKITGDSKGKIEYDDGSKFVLKSGSEAVFGSHNIRLFKGESWYSFKKQGKQFKIYCPTAVIGVMGTELSVHLNSNETDINLYQGTVGVSSDSSKMVLREGQNVHVNHSGKLVKGSISDENWLNHKEFKNIVDHTWNQKEIQKSIEKSGFSVEKIDFEEKKEAIVKQPVNEKPVEKASEEIIARGGDLNKDGEIDEEDIRILRKFVRHGIEIQESKLADVNQDGKINSDDLKILEYVAFSRGDFNNDNKCDDSDLNLLQEALQNSSRDNLEVLDLNQDGKIDERDSEFFETVRKYREMYRP